MGQREATRDDVSWRGCVLITSMSHEICCLFRSSLWSRSREDKTRIKNIPTTFTLKRLCYHYATYGITVSLNCRPS